MGIKPIRECLRISGHRSISARWPNVPRGTLDLLAQGQSFCAQTHCPDGQPPNAAPILDQNGNLYGTAIGLGPHSGGLVFQLTPKGKEAALHVVHCVSCNTQVVNKASWREQLYMIENTQNKRFAEVAYSPCATCYSEDID